MKDKKLNEHKAVLANNASEQEQYSNDKDRIQWHTGFVQAMRLYLKDYEDELEFVVSPQSYALRQVVSAIPI